MGENWIQRRDEAAKEYIDSIKRYLLTQIENIAFKAGWNAGREDVLKEIEQRREIKEKDERTW